MPDTWVFIVAVTVLEIAFSLFVLFAVASRGVKWESGRQGTGYLKKKIGQGSWWDCWLIKYRVGSGVPEHTDPVPGKRHYRINVLLKGENTYQGESLFRFWRVTFFRPDIMPHSVPKVTRERLVFSLGWVR